MDPEPDERYVERRGGFSSAAQCVFVQAGVIGMSTSACLRVIHHQAVLV